MDGDLMLLAALLVLMLIGAAIIFWPRRDPYTRNVTSQRNGQARHWGD
ncbi:MAG: hypothetical protein L0332_29080 [Chloroflexi bacterium]|nr:hypothetical protein [Chloroflexota bacterium]MCI0576843.1 hypothetical protein [Chloroflexota bacterium]MCI0649446.1 hypothetical protein [Chloroflexota bacterium]MCI0730754.1 hypothetical protein [Chloroflexota bacterium]